MDSNFSTFVHCTCQKETIYSQPFRKANIFNNMPRLSLRKKNYFSHSTGNLIILYKFQEHETQLISKKKKPIQLQIVDSLRIITAERGIKIVPTNHHRFIRLSNAPCAHPNPTPPAQSRQRTRQRLYAQLKPETSQLAESKCDAISFSHFIEQVTCVH